MAAAKRRKKPPKPHQLWEVHPKKERKTPPTFGGSPSLVAPLWDGRFQTRKKKKRKFVRSEGDVHPDVKGMKGS